MIDSKVLYYKKYEGIVTASDYVNWAIKMLEEECSAYYVTILSSLREPLNIFEVEDYFNRAARELHLQVPTQKECSLHYIHYLARNILIDEKNALEHAYNIYKVADELDDTINFTKWYEISEMIDDYRYGDNITHLTITSLLTTIENEAKQLLKRKL